MHVIIFYCGDRGHSAAVKLERLDPELTIPEPRNVSMEVRHRFALISVATQPPVQPMDRLP